MTEPRILTDAALTGGVLLAPAEPPAAVRPRVARFGAGRLALRRAASAVVFTAIAGASLEATVRAEDWLRYRTPFWSRISSQADLIVRDRQGMHGRANARFEKWVMNGMGVRGPAAAVRKPVGTVRVAALGASETFGLYESPGQEFPRQLEDTLNARLAAGACGGSAPRRFEVLNAALPGMSLPTVEQDLRLRLSRYGVDIALYYPTPVQYLEDDAPTAAHPDSTPEAGMLSTTRALYPRALERIRDETKRLLPERVLTYLRRRDAAAAAHAQPPGWRFTSVPADRLARFERDLRRLVGTTRVIGATPALATHGNELMRDARERGQLLPAWERFYPRATGSTLVAFDAAARAATLRVALDSSVATADVAQVLTRADGNPFADFVHFDDRGAAIAAGAMADAVLAAARERRVCGALSAGRERPGMREAVLHPAPAATDRPTR